MKEYLLLFQKKEWLFFMKPFCGLCFRKKEAGRFSPPEVLASDACEDFSAFSDREKISVVCQDQKGRILSLVYDGLTWQKQILLENKTEKPYPKFFEQVMIGAYINLFYVITYQEKNLLVHQILGKEQSPPAVVDRICLASPPYALGSHTGTDISVLYQKEGGISGVRLYRWSEKDFGPFQPLLEHQSFRGLNLWVEPDDRIRFVGLKAVDGIRNLIYFERLNDKSYTEPVTVYLDCPEDAVPVFSKFQNKLYLVWQENGCIMSSASADDGKKWTKPMRYVQSLTSPPVLYTLCEGGMSRRAYGHEREQEFALYCAEPPAERPEERPLSPFGEPGEDVRAFAEQMGLSQERKSEESPLISHLSGLLTELKEQFFALRLEMQGMKERLKEIENIGQQSREPEEDMVDDLLLGKQCNGGISSEEGR